MSTEQIIEIIKSDKKAFHIGNRMILPFRVNIIKLVVDSHIFTEFVGNEDVKISQDKQNTSIYFREVGRLSAFANTYKSIKIVMASEEADLSNPATHIKCIVHVLDNHQASLEVPGEDDLFIE